MSTLCLKEMVRFLCPVLLGVCMIGPSPCRADQPGLPNPFFVFDNGLRGVDDPTTVLCRLDYAGMGASGFQVAPLVRQYQEAGLKVFSTYVGCNLDKTPAYDPQMSRMMDELQGTDVVVWLTVIGGRYGQDDDRAAEIVGEIAEMAAARKLPVALYPHSGFYVATTADALRLARRVDRPNLGVSINLCHELMTDQGSKLDETIRQAADLLMMVSINGADAKQPGLGWDRLIQPLGHGDFDVADFLRKIRQTGYEGPIGLQCYAVPGDPIENLQQSMRTWRQYQVELGEPSTNSP